DLYSYYVNFYDKKINIEFRLQDGVVKKKSLLQYGIDFARPYRSLIETYVLMKFPSAAIKIKGSYRQGELLNQVDASINKLPLIDFNLVGTPSLKMIDGLTTDPAKIMNIEKEQEAHYNSVILANYQ